MDENYRYYWVAFALKIVEKSGLNAPNPYLIFGIFCQCVSPIILNHAGIFLLTVLYFAIAFSSQK
jgi:hypothetical protein